jgi:hypothetical protein
MKEDIKDITGQRFGSLVAVELTDKRSSSRAVVWKCQCDCGNVVDVNSSSLRQGHTKSCGCFSFRPRKYQPEEGVTYGYLTYVNEAPRIVRPSKTVKAGNFTCICGKEVVKSFQEVCSGNITSCGCMKGKANIKDITGEKFNRLTALKSTGVIKNGGYIWTCQCDCGTIKDIPISALNSGQVKSCGCAKITHGMTKTPAWRSWDSMVTRIKDEKCKEWYWDVTIDARWLEPDGQGFMNFYEDMGEPPEGHTLNRVHGAKIYSKETCEWATLSMQSFDQKRSKMNTSGRTGVYFSESGSKWVAQIKKNGIVTQVYRGTSFEEACAARTAAEIEYYGFSKE